MSVRSGLVTAVRVGTFWVHAEPVSSESWAVAPRRRHFAPFLAALGIAVLLWAAFVGVSQWVGSGSASAGARVWPSGLHPGTLDHLRRQSHVSLTPVNTDSSSVTDEAKAVAQAVSDMSWLSMDKASTVTLMSAKSTRASGSDAVFPDAVKVWAIEFDRVSVPLGGPDSPGEHSGTVLVLVDPNTLKTLVATTE